MADLCRSVAALAVLLATAPALSAQGEAPEASRAGRCVFMTTTPPPNSVVTPYVAGVYSGHAPIFTIDKHIYVPFEDAFGNFVDSLQARVLKHCEAGENHGIVNLRIEHSVDAVTYYFSATFDYVR